MTVVSRPPAAAPPPFVPDLSDYTSDDMLELLTTPVFDANESVADELLLDEHGEPRLDRDGQVIPAARVIANQGGSRSSKTRSLAQLIITRCLSRGPEYLASLVRGTLPALKQSALRDVEAVLSNTPLPGGGFLADVVEHKTTDKVFIFPSGARLEYFSVDDEQKLRGAARVDLWITEANELEFDEWKQLLMRTTGQVFIDFNPSDDEFHWLQQHVLTRADCALIRSTYKDNPYLPQTLVDEIESFKDADENYWRVYGLGQLGVSGTTIYTHWRKGSIPAEYDDEAFGLDFGYTHPTALVRVVEKDNKRFAELLLYKSKLTNPELIDELKIIIPAEQRKRKIIYADAAEPGIIEEIRLAGFNIVAANKSVGDGIRDVKSKPLYVTEQSVDLWAEQRSYKWKVERGTNRILDEPVKKKDDAIDALRYACYNMTLAPRTNAVPVSSYQSFGRDDSATQRALGQRPAGSVVPGRKHVVIKRKE